MCRPELLPVVEGLLAANGYRVVPALSHAGPQTLIQVLTSGPTTVSLRYHDGSTRADVVIQGDGSGSAVRLLEPMLVAPPEAREYGAS